MGYGCSYIKDGSPDEVYCFREGVYQAEAGDECTTDDTGISSSRLLSLLPYPTLLEIEHHTSSEPVWDQYIALLGITEPGGVRSVMKRGAGAMKRKSETKNSGKGGEEIKAKLKEKKNGKSKLEREKNKKRRNGKRF